MTREILYLRYSLAKLRGINMDLMSELNVSKEVLSKWWRGAVSNRIDEIMVSKILDAHNVPRIRIG